MSTSARKILNAQKTFRSVQTPGQKTTMVKNIGTKKAYKTMIEDILEKIPGMYHDLFMEWVNMELVKNMALRSNKKITMSIPPLPELDVKTLQRIYESYDDRIDSPGSIWLDCIRRAVYRIEYHIKA
jgi:hypothetical protein